MSPPGRPKGEFRGAPPEGSPVNALAPLVYITGASSGIGQALAQAYYRAGWRLALVARRSAELLEWARVAGFEPSRCQVYGADVRNISAITQAGRDCLASQGLPDVVVANAGISLAMDSADIDDLDVMRATLETNVLGMAATFQPFVAPLRKRGAGTLVGIASVAAIRGLPGHAAYCASKAAVVSYCESLRGECRASGVKVVTLLPGFVATPLTSKNRYPMPFLMSADVFAEHALQAISAGVSYRVIPWQMSIVAKLMSLLPNAVFDRLLVGRPRKHKQV